MSAKLQARSEVVIAQVERLEIDAASIERLEVGAAAVLEAGIDGILGEDGVDLHVDVPVRTHRPNDQSVKPRTPIFYKKIWILLQRKIFFSKIHNLLLKTPLPEKVILRNLYAVRPTNCSRRSLQRPIEVPVAPLVDPIDLRRVPLQGSVEVCGAPLEGPQEVGLADDGVGMVVYRPGMVVYRPRVVHANHLTKRVL